MSNALGSNFPDNLTGLHGQEELLRKTSILEIEKSSTLSAHIAVIERAMDLVNYYCLRYRHEDENQLTIQLLGVRLFNSTGSALKLVLSGYYQNSAMQQRDLLETVFLLDLFTTAPALIAAWRANSSEDRFRPAKVRKALDDRDGFKKRKRAKTYNLLCKLATHPTQAGFRMLTPSAGANAQFGPFFELKSFTALLEELAKLLVQAGGIFMQFFDASSRADYAMKVSYMEKQSHWCEQFLGLTYDPKPIEEIRAALALLGRPTGGATEGKSR